MIQYECFCVREHLRRGPRRRRTVSEMSDESDGEAPVDDPLPPNPRRYFHQSLRPVYERVTIPVRQPFAGTPAAVLRSAYTRSLPRKGANKWCHSLYVPPTPPPNPLYAVAFKPLADGTAPPPPGAGGGGGGGGGGGAARKRRKPAPMANSSAADAALPPIEEGVEEMDGEQEALATVAPKRKKPKGFGRKVPMTGNIRTYKVHMLPTAEQKKELKRVFAAKRWVYNWCNAELNAKRRVSDGNGGYKRLLPGFQDVRNHFKAHGRAKMPAWASNMSDKVFTGACQDVATAWSNGFDKVQRGEITHFDVHYQSATPKTPSEVVHIPKSTSTTGTNISSPFVRFASVDSNDATADLARRVAEAEKAVKFKAHQVGHARRKPNNTDRVAALEAEKVVLQSSLPGLRAQLVQQQQALLPERRAECLLYLNKGFAPLGGIRLQDRRRVIERLLAEGDKLKEDANLHWDKRRRAFYFIYTYEQPKPVDPDPTWTTKTVGGTDGGIRNFQRWGNATTGATGELACGFRNRIHGRAESIDDLHSRCTRRRTRDGVRTEDKVRRSKAERRWDAAEAARRRYVRGDRPTPTPRQHQRRRSSTSRRLGRKLRRDRARHTGWVQAVHYDAAAQLLSRMDVVVHPKLATSEMAPRPGRVFGKNGVRTMLTMSHYQFDRRLKTVAERLPGKHVISDTGEPGTSRTCPNPACGRWHTNLGGDATFVCPHCGIQAKRDDVGWRGNLLAAYGLAVGVHADATSNH